MTLSDVLRQLHLFYRGATASLFFGLLDRAGIFSQNEQNGGRLEIGHTETAKLIHLVWTAPYKLDRFS